MLNSALIILAIAWAFGLVGIFDHPELSLPIVETIFGIGVVWGGLLIIHQSKAIQNIRSDLPKNDRRATSSWRLFACAGLAILINVGMGLAALQRYYPERKEKEASHKLSASVYDCNPFTNLATGEVIRLDPYDHKIFRLRDGSKNGVFGQLLIDEKSSKILFTVNGVDDTLFFKEAPFGNLCLLAANPTGDAKLSKSWLGQTTDDDK